MTTHATIHDAQTTPAPPRRRRLAAASVAALAGAAVLAATVPAAGAHVQARDAPRPDGARLQAILDRAVKSPEAGFPGVALHVRRPGHPSWSGAAGRASLDPARRMRPGDRFRAGSIVKPFVAAATLQLVEEGRFGLDDPLPAVLPARVTARFTDAGRITVRMLLAHTSGIAEYSGAGHDREVFANPLRRWTVGEVLDRAAALPRTGAPGERHAYSNANYNLLGLVLEHATGKPWRVVVRERVIDRLHLARTSLPAPGHLPAGRDIARGYERVDGRVRDLTDVDSSMAGASGGHAMLTTTRDLSRFLRALLRGELFRRPETLSEMRRFVPAKDPQGLAGYGLGLERRVLPGGVEMVGHMGTTAGYRAYTYRLPAHGIDIAMATNTPADPMPVLAPLLRLLVGQAS
jgi:D-alanyl-D-alanine carboxypeptidase